MMKPKSKKSRFPKDCPHKNFFGCKTAADCATCYYNPEIKPKKGEPWFYDDKKFAQKQLEELEDIRLGRGRRPGGKRFQWKYARKKKSKNPFKYEED